MTNTHREAVLALGAMANSKEAMVEVVVVKVKVVVQVAAGTTLLVAAAQVVATTEEEEEAATVEDMGAEVVVVALEVDVGEAVAVVVITTEMIMAVVVAHGAATMEAEVVDLVEEVVVVIEMVIAAVTEVDLVADVEAVADSEIGVVAAGVTEEAEVVVAAMVQAWIWRCNKIPSSVLAWALMLLSNPWLSILVALALSRLTKERINQRFGFTKIKILICPKVKPQSRLMILIQQRLLLTGLMAKTSMVA